MTRRVDPNLLCELKAFGAVGAEKCIQCGNCTAICSMSKEDDRFPRHMVRMAQLGMKDELLGSRQLWLCFNCGDCSETCPQQAEPANLMAAARGYAMSQYAPFGIGNLFFRTPLLGGLLAALMVIAVGLLLCADRQTMPTGALKLFDFVPYAWIHDLGLAAMVLVGLLSLVTVFTMISRIAGANKLPATHPAHGAWTIGLKALWDAVVVQSLGQKRYREDCKPWKTARVWYLSQWFVHAATMWGFLGLCLATALDYLLDVIGVKATGTFVPLWYPTRLIGTLSGLLFMYGVSVLLYWRSRAEDKAHSFSLPSDWTFLALLWFSGTTGFIIEIALYLPGAPEWGYWMFVLHVAVSITLLLLLPFTKFAHALYRMVALYIHALKPLSEEETAPARAG
jgi:ferredoxin/nitrate reductase gamma subunit